MPPDKILAARKEFDKITLMEMGYPLIDATKATMKPKIDALKAAIDAFPQPISDHEKHGEANKAWRDAVSELDGVVETVSFRNADSLPETFLSAVRGASFLNDSEKQLLLNKIEPTLEDIRHYKAKGEIRRPDVWFAEDEK